jgi:shikimate 5-dehydrogenase
MDGRGMAVHQATGAFELFSGIAGDAVAMRRDFEALVAAQQTRIVAPVAVSGG